MMIAFVMCFSNLRGASVCLERKGGVEGGGGGGAAGALQLLFIILYRFFLSLLD